MARIQLEIPEAERERFASQAAREGKTLDAWLLSVARQQVIFAENAKRPGRIESLDELERFWEWCDSLNDGEKEPDWEEHLRNIDESRRQGLPDV